MVYTSHLWGWGWLIVGFTTLRESNMLLSFQDDSTSLSSPQAKQKLMGRMVSGTSKDRARPKPIPDGGHQPHFPYRSL